MKTWKFPFSYTAHCFDQLENSGYYLESGMGFAESFGDAAEYIESYYGDELITIKELTLYEEAPLLVLPPEIISKFSSYQNGLLTIPCNENGVPLPEELTKVEETEENKEADF